MNHPNLRWRELYEAALLELDYEQLLLRVELAEQAIRERAQTLEGTIRDPDETQAMRDALHALRLLRQSALRRE
jgi:hypothetical protein